MKEIIKLKNCGYKIKAQNGNILFKHSHSSEITLSTKKEIQQCIDAIKDNKVEASEYLKLSEKNQNFFENSKEAQIILKDVEKYSKKRDKYSTINGLTELISLLLADRSIQIDTVGNFDLEF